MRDEHVIGILEGAPLGSLSEGELAAVRAHVASCAGCARAYDAARVSSLLIRERVTQEEAAPSPFFQTRVLAALRERRAADEAPAWRRMWHAAGALVYSMTAVVVMLTGLTLVAPGEPSEVAATSDSYSAEAVLLEQAGLSEEDANFDQTLSTIYESEGAEGDNGQDR